MSPRLPGRSQPRAVSRLAGFKYAIYSLLLANLVYYLLQDLRSFERFGSGASFAQAVEMYATTIEYVAWMILILVFELRSRALGSRELSLPGRAAMAAVVALCALSIAYALSGYLTGLYYYDEFEPYHGDVCGLGFSEHYYLNERSEYIDLAPENCGRLVEGEAFYYSFDQTVSDSKSLALGRQFARFSLLYAGAWLLLMLLSQLDVVLERRHAEWPWLSAPMTALRAVLYVWLFTFSLYCAVAGYWVDAWDALLWGTAFVVIDLDLPTRGLAGVMLGRPR